MFITQEITHVIVNPLKARWRAYVNGRLLCHRLILKYLDPPVSSESIETVARALASRKIHESTEYKINIGGWGLSELSVVPNAL